MPKLILVGGFLGSGKTTLLAEAAKKLTAEGKSVGLITNDQAPDLVDTRLLGRAGKGVSEVSGSCFCCNFNGFVDAVKSLIEQGAETIVAEPVGSCTDLSATIMNPLKKFHPDWELAPLTVLVDPNRFLEALDKAPSKVDPDALYIMKLQMDEADRILVNKADTLSDVQRQNVGKLLIENFPDKSTGLISAKSGEGVDAWLTGIQNGKDAGKTIVEVDYDRYARGEAVLGWLNASAKVRGGNADAAKILRSLMTDFQSELKKRDAEADGIEIGHVKAILNLDGKECVANLTRLDGEVDVREVDSKSDEPVLVFNARVQMAPEALEKIVRGLLDTDELDVAIETLRCLMPGRPNPTYRFAEVV